MKKTLYYKDELSDDFAGKFTVKYAPLGQNFKYVRKGFWYRAASFVLYRLIAAPAAYVYRLIFGVRIKNRRAVRKAKGGCFLYANHTMAAGDAFCPSMVSFPKKTRVVVSPSAVTFNRFVGSVVPMVGGVPLPCGLKQTAAFKNAIEQYIKDGECVTVYPEAHIWKYYTGIRPFTDASFRYPAELGAPVFVSTTTYKKRLFGSRPRAVLYVDGPFYPDMNLPPKERRKVLRNQVYNAMVARSALSDAEYYTYIKEPSAEQAEAA